LFGSLALCRGRYILASALTVGLTSNTFTDDDTGEELALATRVQEAARALAQVTDAFPFFAAWGFTLPHCPRKHATVVLTSLALLHTVMTAACCL
jgi:hypothetical protein